MSHVIYIKSVSANASVLEILKTCQSFLVFLQKTLVPILLPYKRKLLETHAIPKNCPIYFSMIKKMPLNILQQKLQIYTQTGSSRGQWSHWFVVFFCPFPPFKNCILTIASKQSIKSFIFHNLALVRGLQSRRFAAAGPERQLRNMKIENVNRDLGFSMQEDSEEKKKK